MIAMQNKELVTDLQIALGVIREISESSEFTIQDKISISKLSDKIWSIILKEMKLEATNE